MASGTAGESSLITTDSLLVPDMLYLTVTI